MAAVLSSTFFTLIFPLSFAVRIVSMSDVVVVPKGISVITNVFLSRFSIFARTRILPPRIPSLYLLKSAIPPVGKSGIRFTFLFLNTSIEASISSIKL